MNTEATMIDISKVNLSRALRWHPKGLASWSMSDWACALGGEVGEVCEVIENPLQINHAAALKQLANEIGDVYAYLDLFAQSCGASLRTCVEGYSGKFIYNHSQQALALALAKYSGKLQDVVKKLNRVRDGLAGNRQSAIELDRLLMEYIGAMGITLELLAECSGLHLVACVVDKFNDVSERMGLPERL